jgi:hypothetical protein
MGTFRDRQIRQRRMVRDQLVRADRTVGHLPPGPGGDREIGMRHLQSGGQRGQLVGTLRNGTNTHRVQAGMK